MALNKPTNLLVIPTYAIPQISLSWDDNVDAASFIGWEIERKVSSTGLWANIYTTAIPASPHPAAAFADTAVARGGKYWYRVRAFMAGPVYSSYSPVISAALIAAPSSLSGTVISHKQIDFAWVNNEHINFIEGYVIERKLPLESTWKETKTINNPGQLTASVSNLKNGVTYEFRVSAFDEAGRSDPSNVVTEAPLYLVAPSNLVAGLTDVPGNVKLTWTLDFQDYDYVVIERKKSDGDWHQRDIVNPINKTLTSYEWTDEQGTQAFGASPVEFNNSYNYRVYINKDKIQESLWSNVADITIPDNPNSPNRASSWVSDTLGNLSELKTILDAVKDAANDINAAFDILFKVINTLLSVLKAARSLIKMAKNFLVTAVEAIKITLKALKDRIIAILKSYLGMGLYLLIQPDGHMLRSALRDTLLSPYVWNGQSNVPGVTVAKSGSEDSAKISRIYSPKFGNSTQQVYIPADETRRPTFKRFSKDIIDSFKDQYDALRPAFTPDVEISAVVMAIASDSLFMFFRLIVLMMWFLGYDAQAKNMISYLVQITDETFNQNMAQSINVPQFVLGEALAFINAASEGIEGIWKSLTSPVVMNEQKMEFDFNTFDINTGISIDSPLVLVFKGRGLGLGAAEPVKDSAYKTLNNLDAEGSLGRIVLSNYSGLAMNNSGLGNYRNGQINITFDAKNGDKSYKIYCNKFVGNESYYSASTDVVPGFTEAKDLGFLVGTGPGYYSTTVGLEADSLQGDELNVLAGLNHGDFYGFIYDDTVPLGDTEDGDWWYNMNTREFLINRSGVAAHLLYPNVFIYTIWDSKNNGVLQKIEVIVPRLKLLDKVALPADPVTGTGAEAGYKYGDGYKSNSYIDVDIASELIAGLVNSFPAFTNKQILGMFPKRYSAGINDISSYTTDNKTFDVQVNYKAAVLGEDLNFYVIHNGILLEPEEVRMSGSSAKYRFKVFDMVDGVNCFELISSINIVALPFVKEQLDDDGKLIGPSSQDFDPVTTTVFSNSTVNVLVVADNSKIGTEPPEITSGNNVFATPSFSIRFSLDKSFVDNFGGKGSVLEEILKPSTEAEKAKEDATSKKTTNQQSQTSRPPTAFYSLAGTKRGGQGIVYIHCNEKKEYSIRIAKKPNDATSWMSWGNYLEVGEHRFWVMGFLQGDETVVDSAVNWFNVQPKITDTEEADALKECMKTICNELKVSPVGNSGVAKQTGALTSYTLFDLKVNPVRTGKRKANPPDWVNFSMMSIFDIVNPLDALLTNLIDNYIPTPSCALTAIDDIIALIERKVKNFKKLIQDILDLINMLLSILNVGGTGFWWLGINKAHGCDGFIERFKKAKPPAELKNAQFVTGAVLLLPTAIGGDFMMEGIFGKLPSAPPLGDKPVPLVIFDKESLVNYENTKKMFEKFGDRVNKTYESKKTEVLANIDEINSAIEEL